MKTITDGKAISQECEASGITKTPWIVFLLFLAITGLFSTSLMAQEARQGKLYLVSLGNGDPDNITLRAIQTIKEASVVFAMKDLREEYPDLLHGKELHETTVNIHRTYMRKNVSGYEMAQKEVQRVSDIVRSAVKAGKTVAVLDSGDPTIYGPNMWFMEVFEDLNPVVVPGVSCFNAANAALKKGVTSGEKTRAVILTNGENIEKLAEARTTMVFFTMHKDLQQIVKSLIPYYPPETPIAVVMNAGYQKKERILQGTLDTILAKTKDEKLSMYLVYVGDFLTNRYGINETR